MIANYHTHTWRCGHASGEEREYVENAIAGGLRILGFSDHAPVPFKGGYVSEGVRMSMSQLEDYVNTVLKLRDEYRSDIEILLGLEMEYYPEYMDAQLEAYRQYPIQYYLLAQHFIGNEIGCAYCGRKTGDPSVLKQYVAQTKEGLETGLFTYLAHPDLIYFEGDEDLYRREMRTLCEKAKTLGIPLEINLLGIETNRNYPREAFWKIAGEVGNTAIIGSDAHMPENVFRPDAVEKAERIARENGIRVIDTVEV